MKHCTLPVHRLVSSSITRTNRTKYGVLFKSLNSARYPYTYQTHVYSGKPEEVTDESFYVQGTINYIKYLVEQLQKCHSLKSRNITIDRLYTSLGIADWLSARNNTMVGTFQKNHVGIPPELKVVKDKQNFPMKYTGK